MERYTSGLEHLELDRRLAKVSDARSAVAPAIEVDAPRSHEGLLDRTDRIVEVVTARVSATDTALLYPALGDALAKCLDQLAENISAYAGSPTDEAADAVDNVLDQLAQDARAWPVRDAGDVGDAISQASESYRRSLGQRTASLWQEFEHLQAKLAELEQLKVSIAEQFENALADARQGIEQQVAAADVRHTQLIDKLTELEEQIKTDKQRLDKSIATYQKQFSETQADRTKRFEDFVQEAQSWQENHEQRTQHDVAEMMGSLQDVLEEARDIAKTMATTGVTHEFTKEAAAQQKQANAWRRLALVLGLFAVAAVGWAISVGGQAEVPLAATLSRLVLGVLLGGLSGYAATQSSRHRAREEEARSLEMDLVAFTPFVRDLGDQQAELKAELVKKVFGRSVGRGDAGEVALSEAHVSLVRQLMSAVTRGNQAR